MHALYFGEGMAGKESAVLLARPQAKEVRGHRRRRPADSTRARAVGSSSVRSRDLKQRIEVPLLYAPADLASGRAVLDSQDLRNSSRVLSTNFLASSRLA